MDEKIIFEGEKVFVKETNIPPGNTCGRKAFGEFCGGPFEWVMYKKKDPFKYGHMVNCDNCKIEFEEMPEYDESEYGFLSPTEWAEFEARKEWPVKCSCFPCNQFE